jgi:hypothetical protein
VPRLHATNKSGCAFVQLALRSHDWANVANIHGGVDAANNKFVQVHGFDGWGGLPRAAANSFLIEGILKRLPQIGQFMNAEPA